jgi:type I restriction enzyme M protein
VADLLRGDEVQSDCGKVILLPFAALRRLVWVLQLSRQAVLAEKTLRESQGLDQMPFLLRVAGLNFCNVSTLCHKA